MKLLTTNTKIDKSMVEHPKYMGTILQMLPGKGVCVNYKACIKTCLAFTGFAKIFPSVNKARQARKDLFTNNLPAFMVQLEKELNNLCKRANKQGKTPVCRLNGFTDIRWDLPEYYIRGDSIFNVYQDVIFYDYTADSGKVYENHYSNYHLTFSYKGNNLLESEGLFGQMGTNIAVVDNPENRAKFGAKSIDGDKHDFRFLDDKASIVWLSFKK